MMPSFRRNAARPSCFVVALILRPDRPTERILGVKRSAAALADYGATRDRDEVGGAARCNVLVCWHDFMFLCFTAWDGCDKLAEVIPDRG